MAGRVRSAAQGPTYCEMSKPSSLGGAGASFVIGSAATAAAAGALLCCVSCGLLGLCLHEDERWPAQRNQWRRAVGRRTDAHRRARHQCARWLHEQREDAEKQRGGRLHHSQGLEILIGRRS